MLYTAVAAIAGAACADGLTAPPFADPGRVALAPGETPETLRWVEVAKGAIVRNKPSQQAAFRAMAYLTLAQFAAAEDAVTRSNASRASVRGAVAGASVVVLGQLFPADLALFEGALTAERDSLHGAQRDALAGGVAAGRAVGARAVARAQDDGFGAVWTDTAPVGPGYWFSSAVPAAPPALPRLGEMRPFYMTSGRQFRPAPPPAFESPAFLSSLAEVRRLTDARTAQQDSIAKYWAAPTGSLIAGVWTKLIGDQIVRSQLGERAASRALALAHTAAMDAFVACHDAKYTYWLLRPSQVDRGITMAVGLPNFPAYPSNHACISSAIAGVLGAVFPTERTRFAALATEAAESRIHGGIHYRFDSDTGLAIGDRVARLAIAADARGGIRELLK